MSLFGINFSSLWSYVPYFGTPSDQATISEDASNENEPSDESQLKFDEMSDVNSSEPTSAEPIGIPPPPTPPTTPEQKSHRKRSDRKHVVKYVPHKYTVYKLPVKEPRIYKNAQNSTRTIAFIPRHSY